MSPFTGEVNESVSALGERALLREIRKWLGETAPVCPCGMGDDCAVLPAGTKLNLVTADSIFYGRHFDESLAAEAAGAKLLKRSLSDIAAMGGEPGGALASLFFPSSLRLEWLRRFTLGLREEAAAWGAVVCGGDLCETDGALGGSLALWGHASRPLTRQGGQAGDCLLVTGTLGGSSLGKHHAFTPRLREGRRLAGTPGMRAMIDVSDGLAKDLPELLPPGTAASLDLSALPLSADARRMSARTGQTAEYHAFCDGEDHELLAVRDGRADMETLLESWRRTFETPLTVIGKIVPHAGPPEEKPLLDSATSQPLAYAGYEHLRPA